MSHDILIGDSCNSYLPDNKIKIEFDETYNNNNNFLVKSFNNTGDVSNLYLNHSTSGVLPNQMVRFLIKAILI